MQNDKLLPCPFCGYHGTLHSIDMCNTVYAVCMKCGSRTMDFKNGEDAIKTWNTRKPMEQWKDIKGYEGLYQVSNLGRVKSLERYKKNNGNTETLIGEKILKQSINNKGYCRIHLCKDAHKKAFSVHRLVAEAFIPNPYNISPYIKPEINHKDEDKTNNNADNLEWCDSKYNNNYGNHNIKVSVAKGRKVQAYDLDGNLVMEFHSISEAQRQTGIAQQCISFCLAGKYKQAGGYVWKDADIRNGGKE